MPIWFAVVGSIILCMAVTVTPLLAQPATTPSLALGAAVAVNCPGANDGLPVVPCTRWGEASPGVHPRVFADGRPVDRLLLSVSLGTLQLAATSFEATAAGSGVRWLVKRPARTSWHVAATAAYVAGSSHHHARAFVGGGVLGFRDRVRVEVTGADDVPPPSWLTRAGDSTGGGAVFTAGVLVLPRSRWSGKVAYVLSSHMADADRSDGGWRHELAIGVAWRVRTLRSKEPAD